MVWIFFLWQLFKLVRSATRDHEQLALQVAELDQYAGEIGRDCDNLQNSANEMRGNLDELEQHQNMVSDAADSIHYAIVQMGCYASTPDLTPRREVAWWQPV